MRNRPLRPSFRVSAILAAAVFCASGTFAAEGDDKKKPTLKPTTGVTEPSGKKTEETEVKTDSAKPKTEPFVSPWTADTLQKSGLMDPDGSFVEKQAPSLDKDGTSDRKGTLDNVTTFFGPMVKSLLTPPEPEEKAGDQENFLSKKVEAKQPLSDKAVEIISAVVTAKKNEREAPPEKKEEVLLTDILALNETLKGERPPDIPQKVYERILTEVADSMNSLGAHKSTPKQVRERIYKDSTDLVNPVIESSSDQSGEIYRDALNVRARSNLGLGRYQPAIDDATTVSRLSEDDERAYTTRALAYYQMQNYNQAMEDSKRALRINPNNQTAFKIAKLSRNRLTTTKDLKLDRIARAAADQIDREYESMEEEHSDAERIAPQTQQSDRVVDSLNTQALSYTRNGKHQAAYDTYTKALARDPSNEQALQNRGRTASIMGRYRAAITDASAILDKNPNDPSALLMRSRALSQIGRFKEAHRDANRLVGISPDNAAAYKARGRAKENTGELQGMIADFRRAAALDPGIREELRPTARRYDFNLDGATDIPTAKAPAPKAVKKSKGKRFLVILGFSVAGGLLIAYGALQFFLTNRRERRRKPSIIENAGEETNQTLAAGGELEGGFKILRVLGNGGMGVVYEAEDKALDRKVAIKKMREEIQEDPRERSRFLQEARLVAKMHHPNIVDIHSIVEDNGELYLVFEHVDGETLDQVMNRKKQLTVKETQFILRGVCHALEYAHHKAIIHRDLKPSNIMITTEGRVKVMDFGIARQAKDALLKSTKTNHVAGTPQYMAPEQEEGTIRPESDVFSLGTCLYELVTGERPFTGPSTTASKINKRYTRASRVRKELPQALDQLIDDCLEPDPDKRISTVVEFRARLDAIQITESKPA